MRIAYICGYNTYPPRDASTVHSYEVTSRLLAMGHKLYGFEHEQNPNFRKFPLTKTGALKMANHADALYIRGDYYCHSDLYTLLKLLRFCRLPVIWEMNAPLEELYAPGINIPNVKRLVRKGNRKRKLLAPLVDAAICVSEEMKQYSMNYLKIKNSYLVPNGSNASLFTPDKPPNDPFKAYEHYTKVLWAGSPNYPWQGYDIILELSRQILAIADDILFILTSKPASKEYLKMPNVLFTDKIEYNSLPNYVASADITVALYHDYSWCKYGFYGSPLKLFDYMSCAKPVIASNLGQISTIIQDGTNGLLTDNTIDDLINKIVSLRQNPDYGIKLGKNARKSILDYYNWDRVVEQTIEIISNTIKR